MLEGRKKDVERVSKHTRSSSPALNAAASETGTFRPPNEDSIMTRKPIRLRRQRIPILQSGYCPICNLPYNSIEDHVQSKKHQKLIGADANFIALNGYIHADVGIESLLSLTGIDPIGFDDFTPKTKRRNMPRTRAASVVSDIVKPTQTFQGDADSGHRLRSRKTINYMTPPLDEDRFHENKPDLEPVRLEYKEYRELRSSTRALAKLTSCTAEPELWESGRPKRACINRQKIVSANERLVADNQAYYKVEVLSNKLRPNDKEKGSNNKQKESKTNNSDKGLIVKFKKLRTSELVQLNNEATNFLFPKKDDSSSDEDGEEDEEEEGEENGTEDEIETTPSETNEVCSSSEPEDAKPPDKFKVEDEVSMDSTSSDCKARKKRRSHAEAFIMDNQKYYKFETPGSRLRYHGSYLSPVPAKANGDLTKSEAKVEPKLERGERNGAKSERLKLNLDEFTFSFETVPENEKWYQTFRRQDRSEQRYHFSKNYHWNDFVLPHQIPHLRAIDPRTCYNAFRELKDCICKETAEPNSGEASSGSDMDICETVEELPKPAEEVNEQAVEQPDEDSKSSEISSGSVATTEEIKEITSGGIRPTTRKRRPDVLPLSPSSSRGRNARKSPRQHASTLAILSSLVHQRKRRSRTGEAISEPNLQTIPEEPAPPPVAVVEQQKPTVPPKPHSPQRQRKKKVDYNAIAAKIEDELNTALDFDTDFEPTTDPDVGFLESRLNVDDIMRMYEDSNAKENELSCRRFFNGAPGRKPGKRKKNLTGWPNKVKRKKVVKGENESVNGRNAQSDEEEENGDADDSISEPRDAEVDLDDRENKCDRDNGNRVENSSEIRDTILQPYVYVKKLDSCEKYSVKKLIIKSPSKRIPRRPQRRIISARTTKSPRMLRRCRGRWYRDR